MSTSTSSIRCLGMLERVLDRLHARVIAWVPLRYFTACTRLLLAIGFTVPALPKLAGVPFTNLPTTTPVGAFFAGFFAAPGYYAFVGEAASGEEAVRLAAELVPDVVLMDLRMPGMDGVEATRRVVRASPRSRVVVLTSHHDDEHVFPALRAGALSYLLKDLTPDELADAVRRAVAGEATLHPRVAARVVEELRGPGWYDPNPLTDLTDREFEILRLVADGRSNAEIGDTLGIGVRTIKGHVSNILSKLQIGDRTQAAVLAWKRGVAREDGS